MAWAKRWEGHPYAGVMRCPKHEFVRTEALCGRCGYAWCRSCLVWPWGSQRAPLCVACAIFWGGVRLAGAIPPRAI
jgi:hypothetical protein